MSANIPEEQHNIEIYQNLEHWNKKKSLQNVYNRFYNLIKNHVNFELGGKIVELGSGVGNLKTVIPDAICTDLFNNPWIDQVENAYQLTFNDQEVSNLILFDVFHHLQYPGNALKEFERVLKPGGRIIIFEPDISWLGYVVYGLMHHEPINRFAEISWNAAEINDFQGLNYYAAQGNAHRVFLRNRYKDYLKSWNIINKKRIAAISYIFTGGYSKPQIFPDKMFGILFMLDKLFSQFPFAFSTRLLVVLEKK